MAQIAVNYADKVLNGGPIAGKWRVQDANEVKAAINANAADVTAYKSSTGLALSGLISSYNAYVSSNDAAVAANASAIAAASSAHSAYVTSNDAAVFALRGDLNSYITSNNAALNTYGTAFSSYVVANNIEVARINSVLVGYMSSNNSAVSTVSTNLANYISSNNTAMSSKADLVGGLIPSSQLPSYVDDVIEKANYAALPVTGETGKIYVTLDTNFTYRWSGSVYVQVGSESLLSGGTMTNTLTIQTTGVTAATQLVLKNLENQNNSTTGINFWGYSENAFSVKYQRVDTNSGYLGFNEERITGLPILRLNMADRSAKFFQNVEIAGSGVTINGAAYTWPAANAAGVLGNNGAGGLTWNNTLELFVNTTPTPTTSGTKGQMFFDSGYFYLCTDTNVWKRVLMEQSW
jgi:hypothetical protein